MTLRSTTEDLLHRLVNNPFAMLYAGLGTVGTVWGSIAIYRELTAGVTGGWLAPLQLGFAALLLCPAAGWWLTSHRRRYGIPLARDYIFPRMEKSWHIGAEGDASITTTTTYYFLRAPRPEELADTVFGSAPLSLTDLNYESPDGYPRDYRAVGTKRHLIYWAPKSPVTAGVPYVHTVTARYPYPHPNGPRFKSLTLAPHARTLRLEVRVESELPIREAIAYCGYRFQRNGNANAIARRARRIRHRRAPLPAVSSPNTVEWAMDDVEAGSTYYLVLFFDAPVLTEPSPTAALAETARTAPAGVRSE